MDKNQVLRQRSITGLFFIIGVILLIISGKIGAIILGCFIAAFSCYEYIRMIYPKNKKKLISSLLLVLLAIIVLISPYIQEQYILIIAGISCIFFILGIVNMFHSFINHKKLYWLISILYFGLPFGLFISYLFKSVEYRPFLWLGIFAMIWICDSGAYIIGSKIGKTKLMERVSPKKTWEGFLGAGLVAITFAWIFGTYTPFGKLAVIHIDYLQPAMVWVVFAIMAWVIGTLGDLVESSIKRRFDVKDSGKLLPGHGGVFDRFDSFIYILPFVIFLLLSLN